MPVVKAETARPTKVREGLARTIAYTENLMMAVIDFSDGPWKEPEPLQHHVHEQVTYVAEGEIIFFCEGEKEQHLRPGDIFVVPSDRKHGIQLLTPAARLIDTFSPIRKDFL
jgi:quercetin dioxygenase-like cupin family protein